MKVTLFQNSFGTTPIDVLTLPQVIEGIRAGKWRKSVSALRNAANEAVFKRLKARMQAITMSGNFKQRQKGSASANLVRHSGLICLDIDAKDNPKMRVHDLIDKECIAQFVSCSGKGIKVVYRCVETKDVAEHRRIYDTAIQRLVNKGIALKVDPIVKSIASLQYVTFDPEAYYFPNTKLILKPAKVPKIKHRPPSEDNLKDIEQLDQYIKALGDKDVSSKYEEWLTIAFGLSYSLGESGRESFHKLSKNYSGYNEDETNEQYDACLERNTNQVGKPVTIASVFQIINSALPKITLRHLTKKYNKGHAIGEGEDGKDQEDLAGMVRYKLFLFRKAIDKESQSLVDLTPFTINLNEFEILLKTLGFYRYGKFFIHVQGNIVESVDIPDIMRIITKHIEDEGGYKFTYRNQEYEFSWEELAHLWRTLRGNSNMASQVAASLSHWKPNLLKDTADTSYIPYQNGIVVVNKKEIKLVPYESIDMQIWRERILPRSFTYSKRAGMYEEFFQNVCGRGKDAKQRTASENFKRSVWYFGYLLQGSKRLSSSRIWMLYDIRSGNNGRSGKSIIAQAVGKIRSMVTIDGKQVDFRNRFAFQTVQPWTEVVFIDDPSRYMSIQPLFNMISGEMQADRKGVDPVVKAVKFIMASNWVMESEGASESGRQFVTQVDDFYVKWGKEHKNTITPIVDYHGKELFTDWNEKEWNEFDSFSMRCLHAHYKDPAPANDIIGNSALLRFCQVHENEMFYELASTLCQHVKRARDGSYLVPQGMLVSVIKEHDAKSSGIKGGKIAREFLYAIGVRTVTMTSIVIAGGSTRMAYRFTEKWEELTFGEFKNLPKPNF